MKQIYEDLSDDTDFDIIDLADVPDRDTVKRRKKKSQRDVNKTNKSEEVKRRNTLPSKILQRIHERSGLKKPGNVLPETLETAVQKLPGKNVPLHPLRSSPLR